MDSILDAFLLFFFVIWSDHIRYGEEENKLHTSRDRFLFVWIIIPLWLSVYLWSLFCHPLATYWLTYTYRLPYKFHTPFLLYCLKFLSVLALLIFNLAFFCRSLHHVICVSHMLMFKITSVAGVILFSRNLDYSKVKCSISLLEK